MCLIMMFALVAKGVAKAALAENMSTRAAALTLRASAKQIFSAMGAIKAAVAVCDMRFESSEVMKDKAMSTPSKSLLKRRFELKR